MKVLHVIPSISERSGGPGQAILPMCRALRDKGIEVMLATTDLGIVSSSEFRVSSSQSEMRNPQFYVESPTQNSKLETRNCYRGVSTIFFPSQWGESFKYSRPFAKWLVEHVSEFDVVHIHAVFNHACIAAARACRKRGVPYIVRPLGTLDPWGMKQKSFRKKVFWHAGIKKMLTGAAVIQYTAKSEQQAVEESLNLNHGVVVPLGVDLRANEESQIRNASLSEFSFLPAAPYVLVLSRLLPTKGLDVFLGAFLSLVNRKEFSNWRVVLAGEGPIAYVASLKRIVEEQDAAEFVIFAGWLDGEKKEAALRNASLLALPSHHENFGLCVMESLAYSVPVLVSSHVNLALEIEAASAGWVAEVNKPALEEALAAALSSEEERLSRGRNGKQMARNYAWPNIANQLLQLYSEITSKADELTSTVVHHA